MSEFETDHFGVEFDGRPRVLATESGVVELFAKHAILLGSAAKAGIVILMYRRLTAVG
jgi:hypothetical protein